MRVKWCDTQGCSNTVKKADHYGKLPRFCDACALQRRRDQYRASKENTRPKKNVGQRSVKGRKLIPYAGFDPSEGRSWSKPRE